MAEAVESKSTGPTEALGGGVTLLDLFQGMAGAWGLPAAVQVTLGRSSYWLIPACIVGGVSALFGAFFARRLGSFLIFRVFARKSNGSGPVSVPLGTTVYSGLLGLTFLLQYALYVGLVFLIGAVRG